MSSAVRWRPSSVTMPPGWSREGAHARAAEPAVELHGVEHVRALRLAVGGPLVVGPPLEVDVLEHDGREAVAVRAHVHDARRRARAERRREEPGQQEVAEVVRRELELVALGGARQRAGHDARVVHEELERHAAREEALGEGAHARGRREVERLDVERAARPAERSADARRAPPRPSRASRQAIVTSAPADASARAVSSPSPPEPPVTTARRPPQVDARDHLARRRLRPERRAPPPSMTEPRPSLLRTRSAPRRQKRCADGRRRQGSDDGGRGAGRFEPREVRVGELRAGTSALPLEPPLGVAMMGYGARVGVAQGAPRPAPRARPLPRGGLRPPARRVRPLPARAAAGRRAPRAARGADRRRRAERILVGCIHTHSGPDTGFGALLAGREPRAHVAALFDAVVEAGARGGRAPRRRRGSASARAEAAIGRNRRARTGRSTARCSSPASTARDGAPLAVALRPRLPSDGPRPREPRLLRRLAVAPPATRDRGARSPARPRSSRSARTPTSTRARAASSTSRSPGQSVGRRLRRRCARARPRGRARAVGEAAARDRDARATPRSARRSAPRRDPHLAGATTRARARGARRARPPARTRDCGTARALRAWSASARRLPARGAPRAARARAPLPARPHRGALRLRRDARGGGAGAPPRRRAAARAPARAHGRRRPRLEARARRRRTPRCSRIANGWMRYLPHRRNFEEPDAHVKYEILQSTLVAGRGRAPARRAARRSRGASRREGASASRRSCAGPPPAGDVTVEGWLRSARHAKERSFLAVNDGSCLAGLQAVVDARRCPSYEAVVRHARRTATRCASRGELVDSPGCGPALRAPRARGRARRARRSPTTRSRRSATASSTCAPSPTCARARTRSARCCACATPPRAPSTTSSGERGFVLLHAPIITLSDAEGAGADVPRDDARRRRRRRARDGERRLRAATSSARQAHLTVSGQLEAEIAALALGNVYTFGPTFRAENSNTSRHLAEFWMVEPEMAFCDLDGDAALAEAFLKHVFGAVLDGCAEDMAFFDERVAAGRRRRRSAHVVETPFERLTYTEAVAHPRAQRRGVRVPGALGHRPAERARALARRSGTSAGRWSSPTTPPRSRRSTCT